MEKCICEDCFYNSRTVEVTCSHNKANGMIYVTWNCLENMYETTEKSIRPPPKCLAEKVTGGVAMCDPRRAGHCKRDLCTFAHGKAEQRYWNSFLSSGKSGEIMISKKGYIHEGQLLTSYTCEYHHGCR